MGVDVPQMPDRHRRSIIVLLNQRFNKSSGRADSKLILRRRLGAKGLSQNVALVAGATGTRTAALSRHWCQHAGGHALFCARDHYSDPVWPDLPCEATFDR